MALTSPASLLAIASRNHTSLLHRIRCNAAVGIFISCREHSRPLSRPSSEKDYSAGMIQQSPWHGEDSWRLRVRYTWTNGASPIWYRRKSPQGLFINLDELIGGHYKQRARRISTASPPQIDVTARSYSSSSRWTLLFHCGGGIWLGRTAVRGLDVQGPGTSMTCMVEALLMLVVGSLRHGIALGRFLPSIWPLLHHYCQPRVRGTAETHA